MSPAAASHNVPVPSEAVGELPSREGPRAGARTRAREAAARVPSPTVPGVLHGGPVWSTQPPSLEQVWAKHVMSAQYFDGKAFRWPRYAWGAVHIGLLLVIYGLGWVTDSPPKLILFAGVLALVVWLA